LVSADQEPPKLPRPVDGSSAGHDAGTRLRGDGLLKRDNTTKAGETIKQTILGYAKAEGFDAARFTTPDAIPEAPARLKEWLELGYHGTMGWMAERVEQRASPRALWPDIGSVLMLGINYGPDTDPLETLAQKDRGTISVYARNRDYHDVIKGALKRLGQQIARLTGSTLKVFVDTAPVMERALAEAAGLGWQGKHTVLVSREFGSWMFLGAIYLKIPLPPDPPEIDHCGTCRRCLDACPTDAFPKPYMLDARRCISYLTIEHKGPIPVEFRVAMGNRIYGCDDCLAVCPWNKFASVASEAKFHARDVLKALTLQELVRLDEAGFRTIFSGSPIKRIGRDRFIRNVLIAIGNSGLDHLEDDAKCLLDDASPLVRGAAIWALSQLSSVQSFAALRKEKRTIENDADVREEWDRF
jgi:epoxyqueuosine reductase